MENLPPSIAFRLRGTKSNRDAIGAAITIETESGSQTRTLQVRSQRIRFSFAAQQRCFLRPGSRRRVRCERSIRWPSGLVQELHDLPLNHRVWVEEGSDTNVESSRSKQPAQPAISRLRKSIEVEPQADRRRCPHRRNLAAGAGCRARFFSPRLDWAVDSLWLHCAEGRCLLNFWRHERERCRQDWIVFNQRTCELGGAGTSTAHRERGRARRAEKLRALARETASFVSHPSRLGRRGRHLQHSLSLSCLTGIATSPSNIIS